MAIYIHVLHQRIRACLGNPAYIYWRTSMKPSPYQIERIRRYYLIGTAPLLVAKALRLAPSTVIAEYVRLDESQ